MAQLGKHRWQAQEQELVHEAEGVHHWQAMLRQQVDRMHLRRNLQRTGRWRRWCRKLVSRSLSSKQRESPPAGRAMIAGSHRMPAQELAEGRSLAQMVQEGWRADEREVARIAEEVLAILEYLGQRRPAVTHRCGIPTCRICPAHSTSCSLPGEGKPQVGIRCEQGGLPCFGLYGTTSERQTDAYIAWSISANTALPSTRRCGVPRCKLSKPGLMPQ